MSMDGLIWARWIIVGSIVIGLAGLAVLGGVLRTLVAAKVMSPNVSMSMIRTIAFFVGDLGGSIGGLIAVFILWPRVGNYLVNDFLTWTSIQQAGLQTWVTSYFDGDSMVPIIIGAFFQRQQIAYLLIGVAMGKMFEYAIRFSMGHGYHKNRAADERQKKRGWVLVEKPERRRPTF